jgi:hypothetical protein
LAFAGRCGWHHMALLRVLCASVVNSRSGVIFLALR